MAGRRPRMPRVPGAARAAQPRSQAPADQTGPAAQPGSADAPTSAAGPAPVRVAESVPAGPRPGGDLVALRRAAAAAAESVARDAAERSARDAPAVPDGRIAVEPGPSITRLPRRAAPVRRLGPGRGPEQAAQDAARRRRPAPKPVPARSVTGRSLAVISAVFVAVAVTAPTLRVYLNQSLEISAARQDIAEQQRTKAEYEELIDRWEDPEFVKQQARDRLDLVMPGETLYMVTGTDRLEQQPEQDPGARSEPVNGHLPWAEGLWDSVVRAATE